VAREACLVLSLSLDSWEAHAAKPCPLAVCRPHAVEVGQNYEPVVVALLALKFLWNLEGEVTEVSVLPPWATHVKVVTSKPAAPASVEDNEP